MSDLHDFRNVYATLKDFQRATVAQVTDRLYGQDATDRFLVADEVGLGKTLVARGVIAKTIEHHIQQGTERIDIVYICSNGDIARQNIRKLNVLQGDVFDRASRITLLPQVLDELQASRVNFVSFTPGTAFRLRSSEGIVPERVLLYHILREHWGSAAFRGAGATKAFAGWASFGRFAERVEAWRRAGRRFDAELAARFCAEVDSFDAAAETAHTFRERFERLRDGFARLKKNTVKSLDPELLATRTGFIGELRDTMARVCVDALEPDLIILDEFQRFKHLFDRGTEEGELAQQLFGFEGVKVLLLSATPYKMYTLADDTEDDHYSDFLDTLRFLLGDSDVTAFADDLRTFRRSLFESHDDGGLTTARAAKARLETALRQVMTRTERLAATANRDGMLTERRPLGLRLDAADLRQFVGLDELSEHVDAGSILEYWKATSYPLNFMEGYALDRKLADTIADGGVDGDLVATLHRDGALLDWAEVAQYRALDPANAKMRSLVAETLDCGAWRLLWLPPALPYYELGEPFDEPGLSGFTKRLIFSSWRVVPRAIGAFISYEAERRMMLERGVEVANTAEDRRRIGTLLNFTRSKGRLTGMPVLALLYPSQELARLGDPREVAADLGAHREPAGRDAVLHIVRERVAESLADRLSEAPSEGPVDETWYWAAPFLIDLDADADALRDWLGQTDLATHFIWHEEDEHGDDGPAGLFEAHLQEAWELIEDGGASLGRPPRDLVDVIVELAIAGPGVVSLRALERLHGGNLGAHAWDPRSYAAYLAWGFRSLFNLPEVTHLVRGRAAGRRTEDAYWRLVLGYCFDGCLQSVLDEYVHVLTETLGLGGVAGTDLLDELTDKMRAALTLRTVNYRARDLKVRRSRLVDAGHRTLRGAYALRYGDDKSEDDKSLARSSHVRAAFNSPFRPFVLATTSVGQEGLDFHTYCHAVVHWNLPSNPVDLEQREGRVHRYKGHAVRKNVAVIHRAAAFGLSDDPWTAMFDAAVRSREPDDSDLVPYWVYVVRDGAAIERLVPAMPLSRSSRRLGELKRSLAAYRLVFGQPRQDDLVAYLRDRLTQDELERLRDDLQIDLTPAPVTEIEVVPFDRAELGALEPALERVDPTRRKDEVYTSFWSKYLDRVREERPSWSAKRKVPDGSWFSMPAPVTLAKFSSNFTHHDLRHELYIGGGSGDENAAVFKELERYRSVLEDAYGGPLEFEPLPKRNASRIAEYLRRCDVRQVHRHDEFIEWLMDRGVRLRDALDAARRAGCSVVSRLSGASDSGSNR